MAGGGGASLAPALPTAAAGQAIEVLLGPAGPHPDRLAPPRPPKPVAMHTEADDDGPQQAAAAVTSGTSTGPPVGRARARAAGRPRA